MGGEYLRCNMSLYKAAAVVVAGCLSHNYKDTGFRGVGVKIHAFFTIALQRHDRTVSGPACFMQEPNLEEDWVRKILSLLVQILVVCLKAISLTEL
jgi:hypothetical protein